MAFLTYYVSFEKPEMMIKFEEEVEQLKGNKEPMGVIEILMERREKQGIEKGIEKGIYQRSLEIAREMKKDKFPVDKISKFTKLSIEEIEKL
ncbi:hypothetical protein ABDJ41_08275 [Pedobacter sp. ASV1-7]|uniref:hypothetical protein n=1 Tax=Pedobacter sp. ASV1-7 TaxID=3145237 RepID=UPI0032E8B40A